MILIQVSIMKVCISAQRTWGETSQSSKTYKKPELYLIKAFVNVREASADWLALELCFLEL